MQFEAFVLWVAKNGGHGGGRRSRKIIVHALDKMSLCYGKIDT